MKVTAPDGRAHWVYKLYGEDGGHNIATIVTEVGKIAEGARTALIHDRIRNLVGASSVLGNEMRGRILGVTPNVCGTDMEASINSSLFRIQLESGHMVDILGWAIAGIDRIY